MPELGPVPADVAPAFRRPAGALDEAQAAVPFRIRTISSLGAPDAAYVRDDIAGGMVSLAYDGVLADAMAAADVHARVAVVPGGGTAEAMTSEVCGLWLEGAARGTITLVGADGTVHREPFEVAPARCSGRTTGVTFLLQGAGTRENATRLAAEISPH